MTDASGVIVPVTCECGEKFDVPVAGLDLNAITFTCPKCGIEDGFTPAQVEQIVAQHKAIVDLAKGMAVEETRKLVARANRPNKKH